MAIGARKPERGVEVLLDLKEDENIKIKEWEDIEMQRKKSKRFLCSYCRRSSYPSAFFERDHPAFPKCPACMVVMRPEEFRLLKLQHEELVSVACPFCRRRVTDLRQHLKESITAVHSCACPKCGIDVRFGDLERHFLNHGMPFKLFQEFRSKSRLNDLIDYFFPRLLRKYTEELCDFLESLISQKCFNQNLKTILGEISSEIKSGRAANYDSIFRMRDAIDDYFHDSNWSEANLTKWAKVIFRIAALKGLSITAMQLLGVKTRKNKGEEPQGIVEVSEETVNSLDWHETDDW